jgi:asparagine synthase (glutamine-hydrolysing)
MTDALLHRGPDAGDQLFDPHTGLGLGHRRLAIVDLTDAGRQPMTSATRRYVTVFNGEIYNFQELRAELEAQGASFRGRSDTEVMLAAFDAWGLPAAVKKLAGMFAAAVWDSQEQALYLVRDRAGKKPIYYGVVDGHFIFGSELKALDRFPGFVHDVDREALTLYLRHNYVPAPWSIYRGIRKLDPGSWMRVRRVEGKISMDESCAYWSAREVYENSRGASHLDDDAAIEQLHELLADAIRVRMVADVPLGAFLSGGIDSSLIVALMQSQTTRRVDTFTIGFHEGLYDEAPFARAVAKHLGTNHTEVYLTAKDALDTIPRLPAMFDEPFSDSSQIPTYLVSRVARQKVTVALSGDGGDELFCGYTRYQKWRRIWQKSRRIPRVLRGAAGSCIRLVPPIVWNTVANPFMRFMKKRPGVRAPGEKLHKLAQVIASNDPGRLYLELVTHWGNPANLVVNGIEPRTSLNSGGGPLDVDAFMHHMMMLDVLTYLPDDILVKVDRASMAVSLEARAPILDHRVIEFAAALPLHQKLRGNTGKWILRKVLEQHVPLQMFDRPKMGFGVPIDVWLRGPLRDWAEELIGESRLRSEGFFDPVPIRALWRSHLSGLTDAQYLLWDVLMFQAWLSESRAPRSESTDSNMERIVA